MLFTGPSNEQVYLHDYQTVAKAVHVVEVSGDAGGPEGVAAGGRGEMCVGGAAAAGTGLLPVLG